MGIEVMHSLDTLNILAISLGFLISGAIAFLTMKFFLKLVEKIGLIPFVAYRLVLGISLLLFI